MARPNKLIAWALSLTLLMMNVPLSPAVEAAFTDIAGNWARDSIEALAARGIIGGYPDNTFRPDAPVTRGEFASLLATAFPTPATGETTFSDIDNHWARGAIQALADAGYFEGYPDGRFRPNQAITRAESAVALIRALGLGGVEGFATEEAATFSDVSVSHWGANEIELAAYLSLFPPYLRDELGPEETLTRAEAAWMLHNALRIGRTAGTITMHDETTGIVAVRTHDGRVRDFRTAERATILRNSEMADVEQLREGDEVFVVSDRFGNPRLIVAAGSEPRTDIGYKLLNVVQGLFTPEDLRAMASGNWNVIRERTREALYTYLVEEADIEPYEAEALLAQDWDTLGEAARERLIGAVSDYFNVAPELTRALLAQDWKTAREQAQLELSQQVLNYLLQQMESAQSRAG